MVLLAPVPCGSLAIAQFGRPRFIRTDNERCFAGRVFSVGLRLLGIGPQRIDLHCPWQNGRVERFFGTLKQKLRQCAIADGLLLDQFLACFGRWYNELRPHQNLGGAPPLEAWQGVDPFHAPGQPKAVDFMESWDGLLAGFRIRR
jgi:putative transposase